MRKIKQKKISSPDQAAIAGVPGLNNWAAGLGHKKYTGPLPDFTGQLRCFTGVQDMGKDRIILIPEHQLESKKLKYPLLRVIETVQRNKTNPAADVCIDELMSIL